MKSSAALAAMKLGYMMGFLLGRVEDRAGADKLYKEFMDHLLTLS